MQVQDQIVEQATLHARRETNGHKQHNLQLLLASLQNGSQKLREGTAIVFASASSGSGATHVAKLFAVELARHTSRRTLVIDSGKIAEPGSRRLFADALELPFDQHR